MDVTKAAMDFPDLNFLIYHSGFKGLQDSLPEAENGLRENQLYTLGFGHLRLEKEERQSQQHLHGNGQHFRTDGFE